MSMFGYLASKYAELQGDESPVIAGVGLVRLLNPDPDLPLRP